MSDLVAISTALRVETENTPLQNKLNDLAELIAKIGGAAGLFLFIGLMIEFFVQLGRGVPQRLDSVRLDQSRVALIS
jgi:Ca2+-transporting ATPase